MTEKNKIKLGEPSKDLLIFLVHDNAPFASIYRHGNWFVGVQDSVKVPKAQWQRLVKLSLLFEVMPDCYKLTEEGKKLAKELHAEFEASYKAKFG